MLRPSQEVYLAELVRAHREQLEELAAGLAQAAEPLSEREARLVELVDDARLAAVESALRHDARSGPLGRIQWMMFLVSAAMSPRIGLLRHHEPKPIYVPAKYLLTTLPDRPPTISIVTPSYQQGRFLDRTLYSVASQQYPALEYVVQDGASSDGTVDVLRRFGPLLTSWRSEPDGGQADAINRGFDRTSGEIMAWLNSDDLLLPGTLAYVAQYFAQHPEVDVVYGNRIMIDDGDGHIGSWILPKHDDLALTLADYVPQETLFWRRRIWEAAGGSVDSSFAFALDWDLLLRFRDAGARMVRLPRFLGAFRVHAEQKTTVDDEVGREECDRLRQRVHGRPVPLDEVLTRLRPYLRRHVLIHNWNRFVDQLPLRRAVVRTVPDEPWVGALEQRAAPELPKAGRRPAVVSPLAPTPLAAVEDPKEAVAASATVSAWIGHATGPTPDSARSGGDRDELQESVEEPRNLPPVSAAPRRDR